ncbi:substrate-binding periplasmic protein [Aestuariispira ectoiniformans]|uniref:substrate-binding periplasmic protein n=1 Tax=Aestuariispira ectoiniformans TaxID=2775080 RepID=UPI00223B1890|nr:transporter substrate-binding domain-containing protein [Aestuariispira ectoiniformans]
MLTKYRFPILIVAAILSVACNLALTRQSDARELVVGVSDTDYTPFYFEKDDAFHGAAAEIVQHLAKELGHSLSYKRFPWKRVQFNLATGQIDMVLVYFKTPARAKTALYVDIPHIYESSSLVVNTGSRISYDGDINTLADYSFGNVAGYWHGKDYSLNSDLQKLEFSTTKDLLATLVRGRIDIAVCNKPVMSAIAEEMGLSGQIRFLEPKIDYAPDYIAFSKAAPDAKALAASFSKALKAFVKTEEYKAILSKYRFESPSS